MKMLIQKHWKIKIKYPFIVLFDTLTGQNMPEYVTYRKLNIFPALDLPKIYLTSTRNPP